MSEAGFGSTIIRLESQARNEAADPFHKIGKHGAKKTSRAPTLARYDKTSANAMPVRA